MVRSGSARTVSMIAPATRRTSGSSERRASASATASGIPITNTAAKMNTVSDRPPHCSVVTSGRPRKPPYISATNTPNPVSQIAGSVLRPQRRGMHERIIVATMTRQASAERHCSS